MTKISSTRIILITVSVLSIVGVVLLCWTMATADDRNVISVSLKDGETTAVEFENLALVPGDMVEYTVKFKGNYHKRYDVLLDFSEKEEKTLKYFARVKIISNDEIIYDDLLATILGDDAIALPVDFKEDKNTELTVVYYLPAEVGNEAKNAEAMVEMLITASNE